MKIINIHLLITNKKLNQIIKEAKKELLKKIMTNPASSNKTILKSELGVEDE